MRTPLLFRCLLPLAIAFAAAGGAAQAQDRDAQDWLEQCRERGGYDRDGLARHCELRELTLPADGRTLRVDGRANGSIHVQGWDRPEIRVQALVAASAPTQAQAEADARAIEVRGEAGEVGAAGPSRSGRGGWSVSYRVYVPHRYDLDLRGTNGSLRARGVEGRIEMQTTNGSIRLDDVAGDVRGRTTNGSVHLAANGSGWRGAGVELRTTNGSVNLQLPADYSGQLELRTVHGRIDSEIPLTVQGSLGRELSARLGAGGPPLRLQTTNGSVRIRRQ